MIVVAMPINIIYPGGKSVSKLNGMDSNWRFFRLLIATHIVGYSDDSTYITVPDGITLIGLFLSLKSFNCVSLHNSIGNTFKIIIIIYYYWLRARCNL